MNSSAHIFSITLKLHLPQVSTAAQGEDSCCPLQPALLLPIKGFRLFLHLMGSWAGFGSSLEGVCILHFCCISAQWMCGRFFLNFITIGRFFSPFDGQKFLKSSTIGRPPGVTTICQAMSNYFVSVRFLYRVEVSLNFSWINFFFWGSLWTVYTVQAENSVSLFSFQRTSTAWHKNFASATDANPTTLLLLFFSF